MKLNLNAVTFESVLGGGTAAIADQSLLAPSWSGVGKSRSQARGVIYLVDDVRAYLSSPGGRAGEFAR